MNYKVINKENYYRKGVYEHFTKGAKCSMSMTARIDVTSLFDFSKNTNTKFYINFLYILSKALNSRDDYKMVYDWKSDELRCYDVINPTQYIFHEDTETCTPVYTNYDENNYYIYRPNTEELFGNMGILNDFKVNESIDFELVYLVSENAVKKNDICIFPNDGQTGISSLTKKENRFIFLDLEGKER